MDFLIDPIGAEFLSRSIDWGKARIRDSAKKKKVDELITEAAMRASMTASRVDLGAKFKDPHLVEELLAHRHLIDIGKNEAIRRFLGEGYDDSAYEFVSEFWDSVNAIMSTGEESLADRKAVEGIETANKKLDVLLERTQDTPKEDAEGKLPMQDNLALTHLANAFAAHNEVAAKRSGTYQLGEIVNELMTGISSDTRETLFEYRNEQLPLLQCLRESWDKKSWKGDSRPNFMLVGEGGIGKTVSMLATAKELCRIDVPAVYIPLHALPFLNVQGSFICNYIEKNVLKESSFALELLEASLRREASEKPSLVMLLDGWNEISEREVGGNCLTDIIQEEIEDFWLSPKNVQVVIAGRAPLDAQGHRWRDLKAQSLKRANIEAYLKSKKVLPPKEGNPIWKSLGNPLMLTLYACNETQKNNCKDNPCCRFIDDDRANAQAAVIWNFLQCQINKACLISKRKPDAFPKILAVHYAAAYIGWEMVQSGVFRISRRGFVKLLDEAKKHFESVWKKSSYVEKVGARCNIFRPTWDANALFDALFFSTKLLINETPLSASGNQQDDDSAEYSIGFLHQNFRDFYAALFMRNEFAPFGTLRSPEDSTAWVETPQSHEILDMLAKLFDEGELDKLWNSTEGVTAEENSNAMFHVVEVLQRRKSLSDRSFENRDLRFVSLRNRGFSGSDVNFSGSMISSETFLSDAYLPGMIEVMWLPSEDGGDGRYILTYKEDVLLALWDVRTGFNAARLASRYLGIAINHNGQSVVLAHTGRFDIYDASTIQRTACYTNQNKDDSVVDAVAIFPDSSLIAYGGRGAQAYLYNIATDETIPLKIPNDHRRKLAYKNVRQIVCSENGNKVAILYGLGVVAFWAVKREDRKISADCEVVCELVAKYNLESEVADLQINKDGSRLLVATTKAEVYISEQGDASSWEKLDPKIEEYDAFKVSFKHNLLAVAFDNHLDICSLRNDKHRISITMATGLDSKFGKVRKMDFSPSGERLVCIHEDKVVTAWDVRPNYSGLEKRPLFTIGNIQETFRGIRLQVNNTLLTLTGQGRFLRWDALNLCCTGDFTLEGIVPDYWDSSSDGSRYCTSTDTPDGSLICVYDAQRALIKARQHENRMRDIRLDEQSGMVVIVDAQSLVCLKTETLDVVSKVELRCGIFASAPLDGKRIVSLDGGYRLIIYSLPNLVAIKTINIWDTMLHSEKQEILRIGMMMEKESGFHFINPEFIQLETFRTPGENGAEMALLVAGTDVEPENGSLFLLATVVDLTKEVATMAFYEKFSGDKVTGIAVDPEMDRFFQSTLSGRIESRELSTGEYVKSVEPIPNIALVNADFRGVEFETDKLRDMVRASGAIVDDDDLIVNVELPQKS